jgi:hypothetical protein
MRKLIVALLAALAFAVLAVACGGDDDGGDSTPTGSGTTASAKPSGTAEADVTPTDADGKTPSNDAPGGDETPAPTGTGPRPTPAAEGTPATFLADPSGFLSENYPGKSTIDVACAFSPVTVLVTCPEFGKFAVDPPMTGQDISCYVLTIEDEPVLVRCSSQEPLQSAYYEIQE